MLGIRKNSKFPDVEAPKAEVEAADIETVL